MSIIYKPSGKAREYSPLAANLYNGCNHQCKYCYAPKIRYTSMEKYKVVEARRNVIAEIENDCKKFVNSNNQVLLSFMHDPYNNLEFDLQLTRQALKLLLKYRIPVVILTKAGTKILRDIDIFKKFGNHIKIGCTLTFNNNKDSKEWEPEAAMPDDRIELLKELRKNNINTWASFEPVIIPDQSIDLITKSLQYVNLYKIGKINNYKGLDNKINWQDFLSKVVKILRKNNKQFYVKHDLRIITSVKLYGNEVMPDEYNLKPFGVEQLSFF